jgi:hypothetical protein
MNDAQTQILGPVILMDSTRRHIFVAYSIFDTLAYDQDPAFVSGQHQDVSGQHQTHLGWATGQSKEKKEKQTVVLYFLQ